MPTEIALEYVPFARIINLLSTKIADLITRDLHVVNRNGEVVETEHALQALRLLCESPDKRQSGHEFVKAIAADYLIDGNALVHVRKGMEAGLAKPSSPILRLRRLNILSASVRSSSPAMPMESLYYSAVAFGCTETEEIRAEEIAHARFFEPSSYARQSEGYIPFLFSKAPRACLTPALKIGLESDKWIANFYDEASKAGIVICFPAESDGDTQRRTIRQFREDTPKSRRPIVLFGGAQIAELNPSPANADARALRMDQVLEIARFYGLSPPSVAVNVTQWGSGIENLTRLDYRRCLEIHLANILAPLSHRMLPAGQYFEVSALQETRGDTKALTELANSPSLRRTGLLYSAGRKYVIKRECESLSSMTGIGSLPSLPSLLRRLTRDRKAGIKTAIAKPRRCKMTISFDSRMAKALGISEDIYARFQSKEAPPPLGAADEERARFDLIGPIVDDDFMLFSASRKGLPLPPR